jgi:predicted dehydrogenase
MSKATRRDFIKQAAAAAATASLASPAAGQVRGANDRIRAAVVGVRGRGQSHIRAIHELAKDNVELAALCDCDRAVLNQRAADYEKMSGRKVAKLTNMQQVFDDKKIDVVCFATPNHWHSLGAIRACQAGKDVYVEKPGCHNIFEGRKMVEAARKYDRIIQHGTQCRSSPNIREAVQQLKKGVIGKVYMARGIAYKFRPSRGPMVESPPPETLDWNEWVGPAPEQPYAELKHRGWHQLWDFGNGEIGNQGIHQLDMMRWGLGIDTHPNRVQSMGGRFVHEDEGLETPNCQIFAFQYDDRNLLMQFEVRHWYTNHEAGMGDVFPFVDKRNTVGIIFLGTHGYMIIPDYSSYHTYIGNPKDLAAGNRMTPGPAKSDFTNPMMDTPHVANFIKAVRSRKRSDLLAEIEEGHKSCVLPHLANAAYRTGRTLQFDPKSERVIGDAEANRYLTRDYRDPFVVPGEV